MITKSAGDTVRFMMPPMSSRSIFTTPVSGSTLFRHHEAHGEKNEHKAKAKVTERCAMAAAVLETRGILNSRH